jgi:hypothetical protein
MVVFWYKSVVRMWTFLFTTSPHTQPILLTGPEYEEGYPIIILLHASSHPKIAYEKSPAPLLLAAAFTLCIQSPY